MNDQQSKESNFISRLDKRYGLLKAIKFGIAGIVGFVVAEILIIFGLLMIYGNTSVPSEIYSSSTLLGLNIAAFAIGVAIGFFVNERITVKISGKGPWKTIIRLFKFEGVYALGNAVTIGVQILLLKSFSLSPALGNIIGAIIAFPASYLISMRVVWHEKKEKQLN